MVCRGQGVALLAAICLVAASANPVRSPGDTETSARRRSAIDRSMIRFGRSPPEITAADVREAFQRPARRNTNFVRFGRSQSLLLTPEEFVSLIRAYSEDEDSPVVKRLSNFVRLGRDPKFIRFGRSSDEEKSVGYEQGNDLVVNKYPERKSRARDSMFLRLGRDSEELNEADADEDFENRRKRSAVAGCPDCQA